MKLKQPNSASGQTATINGLLKTFWGIHLQSPSSASDKTTQEEYRGEEYLLLVSYSSMFIPSEPLPETKSLMGGKVEKCCSTEKGEASWFMRLDSKGAKYTQPGTATQGEEWGDAFTARKHQRWVNTKVKVRRVKFSPFIIWVRTHRILSLLTTDPRCSSHFYLWIPAILWCN